MKRIIGSGVTSKDSCIFSQLFSKEMQLHLEIILLRDVISNNKLGENETNLLDKVICSMWESKHIYWPVALLNILI